eukprot:4630018-Amphidinium_carterae.1
MGPYGLVKAAQVPRLLKAPKTFSNVSQPVAQKRLKCASLNGMGLRMWQARDDLFAGLLEVRTSGAESKRLEGRCKPCSVHRKTARGVNNPRAFTACLV